MVIWQLTSMALAGVFGVLVLFGTSTRRSRYTYGLLAFGLAMYGLMPLVVAEAFALAYGHSFASVVIAIGIVSICFICLLAFRQYHKAHS